MTGGEKTERRKDARFNDRAGIEQSLSISRREAMQKKNKPIKGRGFASNNDEGRTLRYWQEPNRGKGARKDE